MDDLWLSVEDIADYLGVGKDTAYARVASKGMPGHKVGRLMKRDGVAHPVGQTRAGRWFTGAGEDGVAQ